MITGFNTDVEHGGVVYHVQTEDKGLDTPIILSLVYSGGAILASKRSPYQDLIAKGFSDEALAERLKRQHRLICAAIHSGRINDLRKMGARLEPASEQPASPPVPPSIQAEPEMESVAEPHKAEPSKEVQPPAPLEIQASTTPSIHGELELELEPEPYNEIQLPAPLEIQAPPPLDIIELEEIPADVVLSVTDFRVDPPSEPEPVIEEAVEPQFVAPNSPAAYTVHDQRRQADIQHSVETEEGLILTLLDDDELFSGDHRTLRVFVSQRYGDDHKALSNVDLSIKILGTTFRPLIYSVKTERDGVAAISTHIPHFTSGRAAVLIKAVAKGGAAELRRVIHPAR